MKNPLARNCVQPQSAAACTPFHPPSKDSYEPTLSDESRELGLEIDMGSDPKNKPNMKTQPKRVRLLLEPENGPLTQTKKLKPLINAPM